VVIGVTRRSSCLYGSDDITSSRAAPLGAGVVAQNIERLLRAHADPVVTGVAHRVERVTGADDPDFYRNLVTYHSVGVALSIVALVVGSHKPRRWRKLGLAQQEVFANLSVRSHDGHLLLVEGIGLGQNR
jgi:hypothetical protein